MIRALLTITIICATSLSAMAQIPSEQPVIYSQTMISIVPGSAVPRSVTQSPLLQNNPDAAQNDTASATADMQEALDEPQAVAGNITLRVQVRADQIPISHGMFLNYKLDADHGVLTFFADAYPRTLIAENIQKPLDVLFVREDGVIAQIIPEIVLAYLSENITPKFPVRGLLFLQAGLAQQLGIQPGFRIEHGMFKPRPMIYTAPEEE